MSSDNLNREKSVKISLTGDIDKCPHCAEDDKKFREGKGQGYDYEYIDVNSDKGQEKLKDWGVQEGQKVDIPITKVETCSWDSTKPEEKKCKTSDWKDEMWDDLAKGTLE